jgi:hypothetical protein
MTLHRLLALFWQPDYDRTIYIFTVKSFEYFSAFDLKVISN